MKVAKITIGVAAALFFSAVSFGSVLTVGDVELIENRSNQVIEFFVTGTGETAPGLNFNIQVGDGGTAGGGSIVGPAITGLDIISGTIFDGNNTGQAGLGAGTVPQVAGATTTTNSGTVEPDGLLATVTFDTTGFGLGTGPFDLLLSDTLNGMTEFPFASDDLVVTDGRILIVPVPEPAGLILFLSGGACMFFRRRRR